MIIVLLKYSVLGIHILVQIVIKQKRFEDKILEVSINLSSVKASKFLGENIASVCKSSICNMIKKSK